MTNLRCPFCGGPVWLNVSADDPPSIECDDAACWAAWDRTGTLSRPPRASQARGTYTEADSRDPYDPGNRARNHT